jgi:hypothetical protein
MSIPHEHHASSKATRRPHQSEVNSPPRTRLGTNDAQCHKVRAILNQPNNVPNLVFNAPTNKRLAFYAYIILLLAEPQYIEFMDTK